MAKLVFELTGDTICFLGKLDESLPKDFFEDSLKLSDFGNTVKMDFSRIDSGNSMGIRFLYNFLNETDKKILFKSVPLWLLEQFGMNKGFLKAGHNIESVFLPFYCAETDEDRNHGWVIGKDIPLLKDYEEYEPPKVILEDKEFEPDFDFESAFSVFSDLAK